MARSITKHLQFSKKTIEEILERDNYSCVFCGNSSPLDIAHIVNKSQLGLGVKENGITACRGCHSELDNGNKGQRKDLLIMAENYMKNIYPNWDRCKLVYKKYKF